MPKITEEHAEVRRMQILMGAMACFNEKGFHKCTMQDICKSSGLSTGAVYSYFDSKDEIIQALCDYQQQENEQRFQIALQQGTPRQTFDILLDQFFDLFKDPMYKNMTRPDLMMFSEGLFNDAIANTVSRNIRSIKSRLTEIVQKAQNERAVDRSIEPSSVALAMMALFQGLAVLIQFDNDVDVDAYKAALRSLFFSRFWTAE